jgi:hypothetical protein
MAMVWAWRWEIGNTNMMMGNDQRRITAMACYRPGERWILRLRGRLEKYS